MKEIIVVLKLASVISFLLVLPHGDVISIPFWAILVAGLCGFGGITFFCIAAAALICILWILVTVLYRSMEMDVSAVIVFLLFLIPVAEGAREALMENLNATFKTYITFIIVDIATIIILAVRILADDYTDKRGIAEVFGRRSR